jgi:anti-sigma-K factor RskA
MKNIPRAQAFAITLEKKGGNPTPTMEQMFVMGSI